MNTKPKVLHLFHKSYPEYVGYTIRSHFILTHQRKFAHPYALTRPFFIRKNEADSFEKVIYFRYPRNLWEEFFHYICTLKHLNLLKNFNEIYYNLLKLPKNYIKKIVNQYKIDIIHGHTPHTFSRLGQIVAHKKNLPFIYEVRGFWEDTMVALGYFMETAKGYHLLRQNETNLMKKADAIITLGKMMKKELISRGLNKDKIHIVPNAVDLKKFHPIPPDYSLKKSLNINNDIVIGYIGSIRKIEGLEILIKAITIVKKEIKNVKILLVGGFDRRYYFQLKRLIEELKLNDIISFIGQIPLKEINRFYSIVDIIVIPRINTRLNSIVTPLKQLEAMAMQKVVITSDLPALREFIKPGVSGDIFKAEDPNSLAKTILMYISDQELRKKLGESAKKFVEYNYDWNKIIERYRVIYNKILD